MRESLARLRLTNDRRNVYWWHKWTGILGGLALVAWIITGAVMIMPHGSTPPAASPRLDVAALVVSPAAAAQAIGGDSASVRSVTLIPIPTGMAYSIQRRGAPPVLVDASSGSVIPDTPELASQIAQALELPGSTVSGIDRLDHRTLGYAEGPLPVYQVRFSNPAGVVTYVAARAGFARRTTRTARIARMFAGVHLFSPLNHFPGGNDTRSAGLWIASFVAFVSLVSGYWLLLPARRKR